MSAYASPPKLPQTFRFCVTTAAHQIEGNNTNSDWWEWEQLPGKIKNGDRSGIATEAWKHFDEDVKNMKWLGIDTYRFSVEWAKIEPEEGVFDESVLAEYRSQIEKLQANGIDPMITLYHFTLPLWVSKNGGWEWSGIADAFDRFTEKVATRLGSGVTLWITLNEPLTIIVAGYMSTVFPPGKNEMNSIALPMANMVRAHARAYHTLHRVLDSTSHRVRVGLAHHLRNFDPWRSRNPLDRYASKKFDEIFNWAIPTAVQNGTLRFSMPFIAHANEFIPEAINTQDFFGLNYYSRDRIEVNPFVQEKIKRNVTPGAPLTDLGWEIYPDGLSRILEEVGTRFSQMPIWIAENGIADSQDSQRTKFIQDHLSRVADAIQTGLPIEGYCHWTLNDNFEWAEGWSAQFGLFSLEPGTLHRIPRPSAYDFATLIQQLKNNK